MKIEGPTIIEEPTTTVVAFPKTAAQVSKYHNYIIKINDRAVDPCQGLTILDLDSW